MARPHIYRLYPYRVERGDTGATAAPLVDIEDLEGAAKRILLNLFNAPQRAGQKPPHTADLVNEQGDIVFTVQVLSASEAA